MRRGKIGCLLVLLTLLVLTGGERQPAVQADSTIELEEKVRYIAITFDDGPLRSTTTRLLDGLRERGASATFFLVGERIAGNEDLILRMKAEGHQVGNHSWSHKMLQGMKPIDIQQEVGKTDQMLQQLLGEGSYWLRPPYGLIDEESKKLIQVPMIHWSVDPKDWEAMNQDAVVKSVLQTVQPGAIILLHDIYDTTIDAALEIIDTLSNEGYWFVTVEELLQVNGIQPEAGVMYRSA